MPLLKLNNISIAFGVAALLQRADLQLLPQERVCLLGRNGEGKSTLLKIIAGEIQPDSGEVWRQQQLKIAYLQQTPQLDEAMTIYASIACGLGKLGEQLTEYHQLLATMDGSAAQLQKMGELQSLLDAGNAWHFQQAVEVTLAKLGLPQDAKISELSGGQKKRVALGQALLLQPQVLLLDEPTNHLDFAGIASLEEQLLAFKGAILFVSHDRVFLQNLATRIVDLERGKLVSWQGDYANYLRRKAENDENEARQNALFDKKLAKEEVWIRQGIKARRTRNEGRARALQKLRNERAKRRDTLQTAKLKLGEVSYSGKEVIRAEEISFAYGEQPIIQQFSTCIQRGDKIGLLGDNGAGKTTLLQLLLGQLSPSSGKIVHGSQLQVAYFDQLKEQLDLETTVADTVADGNQHIEINGVQKHIMSYLADFLFTPQRARSPVRSLSGGEKSRLLLARLFTKPANLIVMDEPTNDLDLETLEMLESRLVDYRGTLLLVSHDRAFLDNVVSSILAFDGDGNIGEYVGGYAQWQSATVATPARKSKPKSAKSANKTSHKQKHELQKLLPTIEALETQQTTLTTTIAAANFYKQDPEQIRQTLAELATVEKQLAINYQRWGELE